MAHFDIISSQGQHPVIWSGVPKYVGAYLKPGYLEFPAIGAPIPISWHVGDYVVYSRTGKTYRLYRTPQAVEQGLSNNYGASFLYENVQFFDDSKQLEFCPFTDLVPGDNTVHFSTQNVVSFFGKPLNVAERLQACLEAQYGAGTWAVRIVTTTDPYLLALLDTEAEFSVTGVNCLQALDKVYELWNNLGWIHSVENGVNVITIGASNVRTSANTTAPFSFGNGLVRVERSIANADQIGTRLFAYGSMKNMDATYYRGIDIYHAESVDIEHLMIPLSSWGITDGKPDARKAFIEDAAAIARLGLIPRTAYFDGTGDLPDIHPTIERMTIGEVYDAGGAGYIPDLSKWSRSQRIDEIVSATNPTDHGTASEQGQKYAETVHGELFEDTDVHYEDEAIDTYIGTFTTTEDGKLILKFGQNDQTLVFSSIAGGITFSDFVLQVFGSGVHREIPLEAPVYSGADNTFVFHLPESVVIAGAEACEVRLYLDGRVFTSSTSHDYTEKTYTIGIDTTTSVEAKVEYEIAKTFSVRIPQIGFDIDDYADLGNSKTVSMKTGMCAGRDFEVKDATYDSATDSWALTLYRAIDEDLNIMFPNADYEIEAGDQLVLLDIAMPEMYVAVASARLLSAAQKLLADISVERPFYAPQIDAKVVYNENRTLREGMWMDVTQDGNREYVLIDSITIDENGANIPTYEVALRENKGIEWTENVGKSSSSRSSVSAKGGEAETGGGSVKSVGLMVPTGMEVEGSPITGSGVMKIKMAQGYKIPQESELAQYFELDDTLVRLKGQYDYLGPRKGLIFEAVGDGQTSDADLYVKEVTTGNITQRVLYSPLPLITEGDQIVGTGTPGGGGGGGATYLYELLDTLSSWSSKPSVDSMLVFDPNASSKSDSGAPTGAWKAVANSLSSIGDVSLTNVQDGQMLAWDASLRSGQGAWKNVPAPTGTITSVALESGTNNGTLKLTVNGTPTDNIAVTGWSSKADASALNNYALTSSLGFGTAGTDYVPITLNNVTKNVLTAHQSLSGYATQTWVGQQGYITGISSTMVTNALGYTPANVTALANYLPRASSVSNYNVWNDSDFGFSQWSRDTQSQGAPESWGTSLNFKDPGAAWHYRLMFGTSGRIYVRTGINTTTMSDARTIAYTSDLTNYLPLSGGTMSNTNLVTNLNANLLEGHNANDFGYMRAADNWDCNEVGTHLASYRFNGSPVNAFPLAAWSNMLVIGSANDTMTQIGAPYSQQELYFRSGTWYSDGGSIRSASWNRIWHSGNSNKNDESWNCATLIANGQVKLYATHTANYGYIRQTDASFNISRIIIGSCYGYNAPVDAITIMNGKVGIGIGDTTPAYDLDVVGVIRSTGDQIISSDIKKKKHFKDINLSVEQIANAPAVTFDWKAGGHSFGSIAQYWKPLLGEMVLGEEGNYTLAYAQGAFVNAIINARAIVALQDHETEQDKEIRELKEALGRANEKIEGLEKEVKRLRS